MRDHLDLRNISLAKTLHRLRQNIDLHRIIGINKSSIDGTTLPHAFIGHIQQQCLMCIVLDMCKAYEPQKGYQLNSIPGIINAIADTEALPEAEHEACHFCTKYGVTYSSPQESFSDTLSHFSRSHKRSLDLMITVRDKYAAHSEYSFSPKMLPSHAEFEELWEFASDFYRCISVGWVGSFPAPFSRHASMSFHRHLEASLGLKLEYQFKNNSA